MMDLIIRNARLPDHMNSRDIGIADGRIAAIGPALCADAEGQIGRAHV